jgi:hypothetical protein
MRVGMDLPASTPPPSSPPPAPAHDPEPPAGRRAPARLIAAIVIAALAIGAFAYVTLTPAGEPATAAGSTGTLTADEYVRQATKLCAPFAGPDPAEDQWVPLLERMLAGHEALEPPTELKALHAELVRSDKALLAVMRKLDAANGDQKLIRRLFPTEIKVLSEREKRIKPQLPNCG